MLHPKLIDISVIPDEELRTHGYAAFLEIVFKHVRDRDILNLAHDIVKLLKTHPLTRDLYAHMLNYVLSCGESQNHEEFLKVIIDQTTEEYKEQTMTIAEQLRHDGYQKGIHAGMQQGVQQGEHEAKLSVARNLLRQNVGLEIIKNATGLSDQDLAKLVKSH